MSRSIHFRRSAGGGGTSFLVISAFLMAGCSQSRAPSAGPSSAGDVEVGYGATGQEELTSPVSSLTEREIDRVRVNYVEELLEGRIAGVQVTRLQNGEFSVRVRGTRSFGGDTEPLIVVDGIPAMSLSRGLARVSPSDVRRIDVLKGAAATMYGSRGANGVILITTKRGR